MKLTVYCDGSCGPINPGGTAAYGFVVKNDDLDVIYEGSGKVGAGELMSNNVAEFAALVAAMEWIKQNYPDAEGKYLPYYKQAIGIAAPYIIRRQWEFRWIQRALNSEADALAQYHRF